MRAAIPEAALSPFAMRLTTTARRCREAGASAVCQQGYRMVLRQSGGRHGDRDRPINLLGILDGTVRGAKPQNVLGSLRVTEQDCSAVACLMLAEIWEHSARKLGRPERDYSDTVEHLRRLGRGEPPLLDGLLPGDVIADAEQLALSLAGGIMRKQVAEACAWGASVDGAERIGLESWAETWAEYAAIMRRYLLPDPPEEPRLSCDGSVV